MFAHQLASGDLVHDQITIYDLNSLNEVGKALFEKASRQTAKELIGEHSFDRSKTGSLFEDGVFKLCTWRNLHLIWHDGQHSKRSSPIIFLTPEWCYTISGSKYEFIKNSCDAPSFGDDRSLDHAPE